MANSKEVPKKFSKSVDSLLGESSNDVNKPVFRSYTAFPKQVTFQGMSDEESVVLMTRRDPASFLRKYFLILFFFFAPFLLIILINALDFDTGSSISLIAGGSLLFILLGFTTAVDTFVKWYYSVNIITDERIVDVDFSNVLYHRMSEASLDQIQDVSHSVGGILGSIFDYGTVYIQTAGTRPEFEFQNVPRPRDVQEVLVNLLEMQEKGEL